MNQRPIKVMIVDDSAVVRQVLTALLGRQAGIEVIGAAPDPIFAMEKMNRQWPDVLVLDVEMPRMDGITFLRKIMAQRPTPVVICSTLTERTSESGLQALAAGAIDIVTKPRSSLKGFLEEDSGEIVQAVRAAAAANLGHMPKSGDAAGAALRAAQPVAAAPAETQAMASTTDRIVAIGTSTGGTQALEVVLRGLTRVCPGVVIVQHMPEKFTGAFARRLNELCSLEVLEASHGDRILPGRALIAPGGRHMSVRRSGAQYLIEVQDGPLVNRHRPSVDVLFRSVARQVGANALGVIMTGMGDDGARGLKEMHEAGARTAAQDEASCVVWGMPKEAVRMGAVDQQLPLSAIAGLIERYGRAG